MIDSRDIGLLRKRTQAKAQAFVVGCRAEGIEVLIYSTFRDKECQDKLYAQGRTTPGKVVTKVKGGDSYHQYGVAFDFAPLKDGKPTWEDKRLFQVCGQVGKRVGLEWGGDFKSFKDMPHMQDTLGFSVAEYKAGKVEP